MRFHLSAEQEAFQDSLARTVARVCPPARRRELMESGVGFDPEIWGALMDTGLGGLMIPEEHGGLGLGLEDAALALEVIGRTATPGPFLGHVLAGWGIASGADEALKAWLPRLASGEAVGAIALPGPDANWAVGGPGGLRGEVARIPDAGHADIILVGLGEGLAAVTKGPGVEAAPVEGVDRTRPLWTLKLDDAPGEKLGSTTLAQRLADAALVLTAADALGGAEQCLEMSVDYAKQREQFGQVIGRFQALKHQLANMALEVEPARALVWYAAYAWDQQLPDSTRVAALAKAHLADRFTSVTRAAVQAHGGIGYTWEYDLQIWFRRALFDHAWLGAPSVLRERAAALAGW